MRRQLPPKCDHCRHKMLTLKGRSDVPWLWVAGENTELSSPATTPTITSSRLSLRRELPPFFKWCLRAGDTVNGASNASVGTNAGCVLVGEIPIPHGNCRLPAAICGKLRQEPSLGGGGVYSGKIKNPSSDPGIVWAALPPKGDLIPEDEITGLSPVL